jgi:endoglucanase
VPLSPRTKRAALLPWCAAVAAALLLQGAAVAATSSTSSSGSTGTNLPTGDTALLSTTTGTWSGVNAQLGLADRSQLLMTVQQTGSAFAQTGLGTTATPAAPGSAYRGTWKVGSHGATRDVTPYIVFFDSTGKVLTSVRGQNVQSRAYSWTPSEPVVAIAPPGTARAALGAMVTGGAQGEQHELTSPVLSTSPPSNRDLVGPLRTSGTQVLDANGPVVLRGIHRVGLESWVTPYNLNRYDLLQVKRWGGNVVRLAVSSTLWPTDPCGRGSVDYQRTLDGAVGAITAAGMAAIIDLHFSAISPCGQNGPQKMADNSALNFWRDVANRYKSNGLVLFDLFNEPHEINDAVWLRGGLVYEGNSSFRAVGMQTLYDAVRATGAQNVVITTGNGWGGHVPYKLVTGYNVVLGTHAYTCTHSLDSWNCQPDPLNPPPHLGDFDSAATAANVPVMISEFGWPDSADGRYIRNVVAYAQAKGWGWIAFAMDGTNKGQFSMVGSLSTTLGYQPSPAGMPVLEALGGS